VKFAPIDAEKATCPVATACEALGVSRPGYYAWRRRPESARARDDRRLAVKVRESFQLGRTYYGSPRILKDLKADDEHVSRKRVIRLMQDQTRR
jgi:putative transposase